jgi:DNA-binding IclR family transcriptional regulator
MRYSNKLSEGHERILEFLSKNPGWHSPTEIGRTVKGPKYHSSWASPKCKSLVKRGLLERNEKGHYRFKR